jgi:uncharacterized delta-60 repeat protein
MLRAGADLSSCWRRFPRTASAHQRRGLRLIGALLTIGLTLSMADASSAAPGDLDASFGTGGKVTTSIGFQAGAADIAVQPDGKVVAAGYAYTESGGYDFAVARYLPNGTLDTSFSGDGKQFVNIGGESDYAHALILQPDGKIVVVGEAFDPDTLFSLFGAIRLNADGSLDTTFSGDGKQTIDFGTESSSAWDAVLQPDGKIVMGGEMNSDFALARLNTDGSLDLTFSDDGLTTADFGTLEAALGLALGSDGRIVMVGSNTKPIAIGFGSDFAVASFNPDGSPDNTFSGDGKVTTDLGGDFNDASSVVVQSDGKLLVVGNTFLNGTPATSSFALVRYLPDGSLDTTFSGDGMQTTDFGGDDFARDVVLQPDGKIVVVGSSDGSAAGFVISRYNANGSLDTTFSGDGKQATDFADDESASAVALQPDGKIVAAGGVCQSGCGAVFGLARYLVDGSIPPDSTPPETTITSGPSGITTTTTPTFAFSSSEVGSSFQCRIDGASFASCSSPYTIPAVAEGAHVFEVRAIDQAGNNDPTPATSSFTVDLPDPPIQGPPGNNPPSDSAPQPQPAGPTAPRISGLKLSRSVIRLSGPAKQRKTILSFTLSRAAKVTVVISKVNGGVKADKRCIKPTSQAKAKRCDLPMGKVSKSLSAGKQSITLTSKVGGKRLGVGRYRVEALAAGSATRVEVSFRLAT